VADIGSSLEQMKKVGAELVRDIRDVGGGLLIAQTRDTDGNVLGLRQEKLPRAAGT